METVKKTWRDYYHCCKAPWEFTEPEELEQMHNAYLARKMVLELTATEVTTEPEALDLFDRILALNRFGFTLEELVLTAIDRFSKLKFGAMLLSELSDEELEAFLTVQTQVVLNEVTSGFAEDMEVKGFLTHSTGNHHYFAFAMKECPICGRKQLLRYAADLAPGAVPSHNIVYIGERCDCDVEYNFVVGDALEDSDYGEWLDSIS